MSDKHLFIFSAPSGCGKTSLAQALSAARDDVSLAISHTTRGVRPGEKDGVDYYYVESDIFKKMIMDDEFLEHAHVFENMYGTSIKSAQARLDEGQHVILDIDWQGARQVRAHFPEVISVFIMPPSVDILEHRLRKRGQDDEATIARRMEGALSEMSHCDEYDYTIVNDDFEATLAQLAAIIDKKQPLFAEKLRNTQI